MVDSRHIPSIHNLDNDSLLNIFYLYRPFLLGEDEDDEARLVGGSRRWAGEHWWFKLAHVCQRWRNLILGSPSYLGLCLVCTMGTPVADMLAHSPPLPLVIDAFNQDRDITAEDEDGIILALQQRDRIRRIRLEIPAPNLQYLITAIDEEYPMLEYLTMAPLFKDKSTTLKLPETLRAPHLRHLGLFGFAIPNRSQLLTTAVHLVTLCLAMADRSTYFQPNTLLRWLSFMPHLRTLVVLFYFPVPNRDVEKQLLRIPIMDHIALPNLRHLWFRGVSAYMEAFVHRITAPRIQKLQIFLFEQLTFSIPHLLQFMNTIEDFRFSGAKFQFSEEQVDAELYPREAAEETEMYALHIRVHCWHLDWQISSMAQILNALGQAFSAVDHLALEHEEHSQSFKVHNDVDRTVWHKFFKPFINVKTLHIDDGFVNELAHCLQSEDGEDPLELLPELQELTYSGSGDNDDAFIPFIDARQSSGHPVTLVPVPP